MIMKQLILVGLVLINLAQMASAADLKSCIDCNSFNDEKCKTALEKDLKSFSRPCNDQGFWANQYYHHQIDPNPHCPNSNPWCASNDSVMADYKKSEFIGSQLKGLTKADAEAKLHLIVSLDPTVEDNLMSDIYVCRKVTIKIPHGRPNQAATETTRVIRTCGVKEEATKKVAGSEIGRENVECKTYSASQGTRIEVCSCDKDDCNGAIGLKASMNSVIVALSILLWVMFNGHTTTQ